MCFPEERKRMMNPFLEKWLIRVIQSFSRGEVCVHGQGLKEIRESPPCTRPLPSLWRSHGAGTGIRNRFNRLAMRELRRADRSGDSRSSSQECRADGSRQAVCRSREAPSYLNHAPVPHRGRRGSFYILCLMAFRVGGSGVPTGWPLPERQ